MDKLESAKAIAEILKDKDAREQIAILEIAALYLLTGYHVKLTIEGF